MKFYQYILATLNKPFPEQESSFGAPKIVVIISVFVTLFLYIFQPFGISTIESNRFLICLGFGIATFVASVIFEFIVGPLLKFKGEKGQWTFGNWILYNLGAMLMISLANFLFARLLIFGYIEWNLLPHMIYGTFMIGIIPILVLEGFSLLVQEKKYQKIAKDINIKKHAKSSVDAISEQLLFDIPISQIKYVEALQNYVSIGYVDPEGNFIKSVQRTTLKNILKEMPDRAIMMSHRSFLVNPKAIISTSGNAQGLLLQLSDCDKAIPVSRSYVDAFRGDEE